MDLNYTREDFLQGTAPYERIESCKDPFQKEQIKTRIGDIAKTAGIRNFVTLYKNYLKSLKMIDNGEFVENACNFEGQKFELSTGSWIADDFGISRPSYNGQGEEIACSHPIMPVLRLENIDTGLSKVKLAFKRGNVWREVICERKLIASKNSIVSLSDYEIAVTSENAKHLVQYLSDVDSLNYDRIPAKKSVSRLGWVEDNSFSPYVEGLEFDGEGSFKTFFESVTSNGNETEWLNLAKEVRANSNIIPKIMLAASFSSALVSPCSCLPFFVHLWGGSETGKTVGLMLTASVWANPEMGKFIHTFNSTAVAQELAATFVNSLPLILDELQVIKERKDFDQIIYQLSEGVGKTRGGKTGGLRKVGTWSNCILTTGEQPITSNSSGAGAVNRIIEINCEDTKLFQDPKRVARIIKNNYGYAGKKFIQIISDDNIMQEAKAAQHDYFDILNKSFDTDEQNATEKQSMAASLILTADWIITKYLFKDKNYIDPYELIKFLKTKASVDQNARAYEWLSNWVTQNRKKFVSRDDDSENIQEIYGKITIGEVAILNTVFNKSCTDAGFNPESFRKWMKRKGIIQCTDKRTTKQYRINGILSRCVCVNLDNLGDFKEVKENIPF